MRYLVIACVCVGCASQQVAPSGRCTADLALDGSQQGPTWVGPIAVDGKGDTVCLHLDTRNAQAPQLLAATTAVEPGAVASFTLDLVDSRGNLLATGNDIASGQTDTIVHASLTWNAAPGQLVDVTLEVRARAATASTTLDLSMFVPLP